MNPSAQAQQLLRAGRIAEAERVFEQILRSSPNDVEALNIVGLAALRRRDLSAASALFERAVAAHPGDFHSLYHLARARDESADLPRAAALYEAALGLQPEAYTARLHYAFVLDRRGDRPSALKQYMSALAQAQRAGQWLDPTSTPPHVKPLVEQAVQTIRDRQRAITEEHYAGLVALYGASELTRIARGLRILRREESPVYADPRQQPQFFFVPGLPPTPYFDRALFPWMNEFESRTPAIRDELRAVLNSGGGRERVFLTDETERANLRGIDREPTWNGYYFYRHGKCRDDHCAACPVTAAAIDRLSLSRVPGHGPEVLFSIFTAGTHLLPHRGVTNTRSVLHLPLIVPADCALNVGGEVHVWQEGRVVVFDDTYEHEAWNRSAEMRVVMIADVWNPYLTEIERLALADLIGALAEVDMVPA